MSLEEEITIIQFAQGARSDSAILDDFGQLDKEKKSSSLFTLSYLLWRLKPIESDTEQALVASSLEATYTPCRRGLVYFTPSYLADGEPEKDYKFILYLIKTAYQRRLELKRTKHPKWWYWDLSNSEIVQDILTTHRELAEKIYNNPSFRGEFISLAKLWNDRNIDSEAYIQNPSPERQTHFHFITYDEMMTYHLSTLNEKRTRSITALRNALENGLSITYALDSDQVQRLTSEVMERHLQETYNKGLF